MKFLSRNKNFKILEQIKEKSKYKRLFKFIIGCFLIAISYLIVYISFVKSEFDKK